MIIYTRTCANVCGCGTCGITLYKSVRITDRVFACIIIFPCVQNLKFRAGFSDDSQIRLAIIYNNHILQVQPWLIHDKILLFIRICSDALHLLYTFECSTNNYHPMRRCKFIVAIKTMTTNYNIIYIIVYYMVLQLVLWASSSKLISNILYTADSR